MCDILTGLKWLKLKNVWENVIFFLELYKGFQGALSDIFL